MKLYGPPICNIAELEFLYLMTKNDESSTEQQLSTIVLNIPGVDFTKQFPQV